MHQNTADQMIFVNVKKQLVASMYFLNERKFGINS